MYYKDTSSNKPGRYICVAPVTACMESFWSKEFCNICSKADLVLPDGMPIVWALRRLGYRQQQRVSGPDIMLALCQKAVQYELPIGLYGGDTKADLDLLKSNLRSRFPKLNIVYDYSPPFRSIDEVIPLEELEIIRQSGAKLLFVGLGSPKQEFWMSRYKNDLPLVMLGVGAAFLFHGGKVKRAPLWIQRSGLEWLFRLIQEPGRLFKRYLKTNCAFLWHTRLLSKRQLQKYL